MTLSAALLLLAPIAVSGSGDGAAPAPASRPAPVATATVTASARIIRPASVRVRRSGDTLEIEAQAAQRPQTARDMAGTVWIEFS